MWVELRKEPEGFGAFFLNLTTRREGGGVLPRLCEDAGIKRRMGQAVSLGGDYGVSVSNRKPGSFGKIGYIDNDLLAPTVAPGESILKDTQEQAAQLPPAGANGPELANDFPCELLFVVRNLRSPIARPPTGPAAAQK
jgi:hypothetical protein